MMQCPMCGKSNIDQGTVGVANFPQAWWNPKVSYQSDNKRLRKDKTPIEANLCLDCGHVKFHIENIMNLVK